MTTSRVPPMRVDHVSIAVHDIDTALDFFRRCLPVEMGQVKRAGYSDDFHWCDFFVGAFKFELIEGRHPDSFVRRFIERRGEGLHHLSIEAMHLRPFLQYLDADGVRVVDRFERDTGELTAFISPRSAHGVLVQFWEVETLEASARPTVATLPLRSGERLRLRVDHLAMAVHSIEATLGFYRRYFPVHGVRPIHRGYDGTFSLTSFAVNDYKIELIEEGSGNTGFVARFLRRRGEGLHHVSIDVDRLDPLLAQLEADGVRIVDRFDLGHGVKTAFVSPRSAHGVLIQFWQQPGLGAEGESDVV